MTDKVNAREIVLDMLMETFAGDKLSHNVLSSTLKRYQYLGRQDRAFISRIFIGSIKRCLTLDYVIDQFASIKICKMKPLIANLLRLSVYQIIYMDSTPASAACNEAVKLARKRGFDKLAGFVNGILRTISRNLQLIQFPDREKDPIQYLKVTYSVPEWLVVQLMNQYDYEHVDKILSSSLHERETSIRCNLNRITPDKLKAVLIGEGVTVEESAFFSYAFIIKDYDYLDSLEAFRQGLFTVQDLSSMLVAQTAGIKEGDYIIDVCAAPGGKAIHAAEKAGLVSARDISEYKLDLIRQNVERLNASRIETMIWDATKTDSDSLNKADIVFADLPCSGLGIIGKKPDIKYKLTQNQQKELIELQRKILSTVVDYVKPGGILMYSTCTINIHENLDNRNWLLDNFDFIPESLDEFLPDKLRGNTTKEGYLQLLQGIHPCDGFFIAKFRKKERINDNNMLE